ncbi:pirin family protein [Halosquirtibacter xylanolyticus]|uniref:pirin family protein n=1 Tax=Halosquirtibacter xylanolyticus TaxID=3374599 RepID=UPI0037482418|nr:pirin family protein [Prolixibacteraceae bacterium]
MKDRVIICKEPLGFPWQTSDPFLLCVHHLDHFPPGNSKLGVDPKYLRGHTRGNDFQTIDGFRMYHGVHTPGFPRHPHKGFETITIVLDGYVDHSDSMGAYGRYSTGDVQWMTAGAGVQHCEMFPLIHHDKENKLELFQIWLNLPANRKNVPPYYKMMWKEDIPKVITGNKEGERAFVRVVAGKYEGEEGLAPPPDSWAADPKNEVSILDIVIEPYAEVTIPRMENMDQFSNLYFYRGDQMFIHRDVINEHCCLCLHREHDIKIKAGDSMCHLLLLQGVSIKEPVAKYGPFVMNSEAEIRQTFEEYNETEFGGWIWDNDEVIHPKEQLRFAVYKDGKEEFK